MDLQITLVGLNHRTAGIDVREKFALNDFCSPENWPLPLDGNLRESFIISTCNRVEILGVGSPDMDNELLDLWASTRGLDSGELASHAYIHHDLEAVRHVFEVAASLDSMVIGEPQILGQLKGAFRNAIKAKTAGSIINKLMHTAFFVAKRVRNETAVAANAVSISYAAVELAKRIFGSMRGKEIMLVGAGEMAELAATHLLHAGAEKILVLNRTMDRGQALATRFNGEALPFEQLPAALQKVDIVISSTGSPDYIIGAPEIRQALSKRRNNPMFLIDIAVPRDIDPAVNTLDNVYLYDIDDLKEVIEENLAGRRQEADKATLIIAAEVDKFGQWLKNLDLKPTILDLIRRGEQAARQEMARTFKRIGPINAETRDAIETMALALARKLNHEPLTWLKNQDIADPHGRIRQIRDIFNLDHRNEH